MGTKLRTQISLAVVLVALLIVALVSLLSNLLINRQFEAYIAGQQRVRTSDIVRSLSEQYDGWSWNTDMLHTIGMNALYDGYIIKVYDLTGRSVWDAENHDMTLCMAIMEDISQRMQARDHGGEFLTVDHQLARDGAAVGTVSIRYYGPYFLSDNEFQFLRSLNAVLLVVGALSLVLSVAAGWLLARRIARPITEAADLTKRIAQGDYDARFQGEERTAELRALAEAVNHLADSLGEQERLRKRMTADVAHELRTPLNTLGAHLEAMMEGVWEPTAGRLAACRQEALRLGGLVSDLERLAKAESDCLDLHREPVDLLELAQAVAESFQAACGAKEQRLTVDGTAVTAAVDRDRLRQVLINLLDNGVKYTPRGGAIRVTVAQEGGEAVLTVADNGPGLAEEELDKVFERFYRVDKSRDRNSGGAGIGLAIVRSIVEAHGGAVKAHSGPGEGCRFQVRLPKL